MFANHQTLYKGPKTDKTASILKKIETNNVKKERYLMRQDNVWPVWVGIAQLYLAVDNKVCETGKIKLKFCCRRFMYSVEHSWSIYSVKEERERNVLFNDALNTFYLRLYGVRHMVKDHSDSEKGNPLPPHRLLLSINSKGSFICTIPQTG